MLCHLQRDVTIELTTLFTNEIMLFIIYHTLALSFYPHVTVWNFGGTSVLRKSSG